MTTTKKKASTKTPFDSVLETTVESFENAVDMAQGGITAALTASEEQSAKAGFDAGNAYFDGMKTFNAQWFAAAKDAGRLNADAAQKLSTCKTIEDVTAVQQNLVTAWTGFWAKAAA